MSQHVRRYQLGRQGPFAGRLLRINDGFVKASHVSRCRWSARGVIAIPLEGWASAKIGRMVLSRFQIQGIILCRIAISSTAHNGQRRFRHCLGNKESGTIGADVIIPQAFGPNCWHPGHTDTGDRAPFRSGGDQRLGDRFGDTAWDWRDETENHRDWNDCEPRPPPRFGGPPIRASQTPDGRFSCGTTSRPFGSSCRSTFARGIARMSRASSRLGCLGGRNKSSKQQDLMLQLLPAT